MLTIYIYLAAFFAVFFALFLIWNIYITYERLMRQYREMRDVEN